MSIQFTALVFSASLAGVFVHTNQFYITDESKPHHEDRIPVFSTEQIEKAKHAKESRPAEDDPEGHWGTASEGFRLSIRFEKATFTNGEPIFASILLRNVSDRPLTYWVSTLGRETEVLVAKDQWPLPRKDSLKPGATFAERLSHLNIGSSWDCTTPVGTQRKFTIELNKVFDLTTNGEYVAQARRCVPKLGSSGEAELVSGEATFRITNPPKLGDPHQ